MVMQVISGKDSQWELMYFRVTINRGSQGNHYGKYKQTAWNHLGQTTKTSSHEKIHWGMDQIDIHNHLKRLLNEAQLKQKEPC